jgi:hypothetical protein
MRSKLGGSSPDDNQRRDGHGRLYTDYAPCDWCGASLDGTGFQCRACRSLVCTLCICVDERCPKCTGSGSTDLPED